MLGEKVMSQKPKRKHLKTAVFESSSNSEGSILKFTLSFRRIWNAVCTAVFENISKANSQPIRRAKNLYLARQH